MTTKRTLSILSLIGLFVSTMLYPMEEAQSRSQGSSSRPNFESNPSYGFNPDELEESQSSSSNEEDSDSSETDCSDTEKNRMAGPSTSYRHVEKEKTHTRTYHSQSSSSFRKKGKERLVKSHSPDLSNLLPEHKKMLLMIFDEVWREVMNNEDIQTQLQGKNEAEQAKMLKKTLKDRLIQRLEEESLSWMVNFITQKKITIRDLQEESFSLSQSTRIHRRSSTSKETVEEKFQKGDNSTNPELLKFLAISIAQQGDLLEQLVRMQMSYFQNLAGQTSSIDSDPSISDQLPDTQVENTFSQFDKWIAKGAVERAAPEVKEIVYSILEADLRANEEDICPAQNQDYIRVVFRGGPGTGKTTLAEAIALTLNRKSKVICPVSAMNKYQFCLQQFIKEEIEPLIQRDEPCVIVIDEIDQLHVRNNNDDESIDPVVALTNCMNEAEKKDRGRNNPHFIFLATTNNYDNIPDVLRSRLRDIEVKCSDLVLRVHILTDLLMQLKGVDLNGCDARFIESLAKKTNHFSIRDLKTVVNVALGKAMAEAYVQRMNGNKVYRVCLYSGQLTEGYNQIWAKTEAAERYWLYKLGRWFKGDVKDFGKRLLMLTIESSIHSGVNWVFTIPDRHRDEERYQEQKQQYQEQKDREDKRLADQNSWPIWIWNGTKSCIKFVGSTVIVVGVSILLKRTFPKKK